MKKKGIALLVVSTIVISMLFIAGCGGAPAQQDPQQHPLSDVSPADRQGDIPLHAMFSWKNAARDADGITCKVYLSSDRETYESALAQRNGDFFYFKPEASLIPDHPYLWYVEFFAGEESIGKSKVYSFRTQKVACFRFSFSCYHLEGDYEPNIWMAVPKVWEDQSNDFLSVTNVTFSPDAADHYTDETGNEVVMWDTRETPAPTYTVQADIEYVELQISPVLNPELIFDYDTESELYQKYTSPSDFHQSDHPEITAQALAIVEGIDNPYLQVLAFNQWVRENIGYGMGEKDALSVLQTKKSDCAGFASLNVAFCRVVGIPARMVVGVHSNFSPGTYVWSQEKQEVGTHVWYEVFFEQYGWIQYESTGSIYPYDSRITLSKKPVWINDRYENWFHIPWAGELGTRAYQAEVLPYTFVMLVETIP